MIFLPGPFFQATSAPAHTASSITGFRCCFFF